MPSSDSEITKIFHVEVFSCHNGLSSHSKRSMVTQTDFIHYHLISIVTLRVVFANK